MPVDIGLAAQRVLTGCLDTNVASRWSIAMVDEVAWGIGWSSHESSPASYDEADCDSVPVHNRTRTISVVISDSGSPPHIHDVIPEESLISGRRSRDSSSSSSSSSSSRSASPVGYIPASLSSLNDSILGTDTARSASNLSTPNSLARGRQLTKISPDRAFSRSLSPSMAPLTPLDFFDESDSRSRRPKTYGTDSSQVSESGRARSTSRLRWRGTELDNVEKLSAREKWSVSRSRHSSRSRLRDDGSSNLGRRTFDLLNKWEESPRGRSSRAGSQPPRSSSSASREKRLREAGWAGWRATSTLRDGIREEVVIGRMKVRSRSVGFDFGIERASTRKPAPL